MAVHSAGFMDGEMGHDLALRRSASFCSRCELFSRALWTLSRDTVRTLPCREGPGTTAPGTPAPGAVKSADVLLCAIPPSWEREARISRPVLSSIGAIEDLRTPPLGRRTWESVKLAFLMKFLFGCTCLFWRAGGPLLPLPATTTGMGTTTASPARLPTGAAKEREVGEHDSELGKSHFLCHFALGLF